VSVTHTLAVPSGVIPPGLGFMLNGGMNWYDPRPGRAGSIAPGGPWIGVAILQALLNLLDWGMSMQEAVMAPRVSATSDAIDISNRIPRATQRALAAMGYRVQRSAASYAFAGLHGISMFDGVLEGGADPQRDGYAASVPVIRNSPAAS
jgi:gamma-glutamyltranspeptidase/glutathione hydrolase